MPAEVFAHMVVVDMLQNGFHLHVVSSHVIY